MSIIHDFEDINRRVDRKPEPAAKVAVDAIDVAAAAAVRTLKSLGYTYTDGAAQWKPPLGKAPDYVRIEQSAKAQAAYNTAIQSIMAQRYSSGLKSQPSVLASCSFRGLRDDEAVAIIDQYDSDTANCAAKRPRGF